MIKQTGYRVALLVAMGIIFLSCGEDEVLTGLQNEVDALQDKIDALNIETQVEGRQNDRLVEEISQLQKEVDALSSADYVDPEEVSFLEEQISEVASNIQDNGGNISELGAKVDELDTGLGTNTILISQIRGDTDTLGTLVSNVIDGRDIIAETILLVDGTGNVQARLYGSLLGDTIFSFYSGQPAIWMKDSAGNIRVELGVNSSGEGYLRFNDESGEPITTLSEMGLDTLVVDTVSVDAFYVKQWFAGIYDDNFSLGFIDILASDGRPKLLYTDAEGRNWTVQLEREFQGSGFLLSESGLVVTNHHVVAGSSEIEVIFPQSAISMVAEVISEDEVNDLAILQLINFPRYEDIFDTDIPYQVVSSDSVRAGEQVITVGFPLAYTLGESARVTDGIVNATYGIDNDPTVFQIDSEIQPGSSGSPLFNSNGQLIGIITSSLVAVEDVLQNVNFAVKSNYLIDLLPENEIDDITHRENLLAGKSIEEQVEMLTPFMVVVKAR